MSRPLGLSLATGTIHVREYMTTDVETVTPSDTIEMVAARMTETDGPSGFPVCADGRVVGFVTARDCLRGNPKTPIQAVMSDDPLVASPDMAVNDAARVMLRTGIQKLPVVDSEGRIVGIISNADVIRSQIERVTPETVDRLRSFLSDVHGVQFSSDRRDVPIGRLQPTQEQVYADELEGRKYELERGLAEPVVVIESGEQLMLADGHHRVLAAKQLGIPTVDAYVITASEAVELGMQQRADSVGLHRIEDVSINDYARHPLVETTEQLL